MAITAEQDDYSIYTTLINGSEPQDFEREALVRIEPVGFQFRPPPAPHDNVCSTTHDDHLFQTAHMGHAVVDRSKWKLVIDGLVERPFVLDWDGLTQFPTTTVSAFHECYGSPVKPPVENLWRIGCVEWTGVPLSVLLDIARPQQDAEYVWSDGLDHGKFFKADVDRYQKDLPLQKARSNDVLVAYKLNGEFLNKARGGPVRLVVPGWYGTNSTKWLCRLSLQSERSPSPFTTVYYNEIDPTDPTGQRKRPCWKIEPNSFLITKPSTEGRLEKPEVKLSGRAWGADEILEVEVTALRGGEQVVCVLCNVEKRRGKEWQRFEGSISLGSGQYTLIVRATDAAGVKQPISGRRNHAHAVEIEVQ